MKTDIQYLDPKHCPTHFYNIAPDIVKYLKTEIPPVLHPATNQPIGPQDLAPIFSMGVIKQEVSMEEKIEIPEEVQEVYKTYRATPMIRARRLEKALDTPAKIYFKYEGATPSGSHKINSALAQVYYAKQEGITTMCTETGAGQWGSALSIACKFFGLKCKIFMVRVSYNQKPYRKTLMNLFDAEIFASPSNQTESGRKFLKQDPNHPGSLGIAISEGIEAAVSDKTGKSRYCLGSVLNHVLLHQTIVGQEVKKQMENFGDYPDVVIGCIGGGSNFAGMAFPFIKDKFLGKKIKFIAVEPTACPSTTQGEYKYDFGDSANLTPLIKMYTLGSNFIPSEIHAGGLRYHGMAPMVSLLINKGLIDAVGYQQREVFEAGALFARCQGIVPAPESCHAIKAAIDQAVIAKQEGKKKVIVFNLSGHGHFDMQAYTDFMDGRF